MGAADRLLAFITGSRSGCGRELAKMAAAKFRLRKAHLLR